MEKRLFLAVVLSFFVVMAWSLITPKPSTRNMPAPVSENAAAPAAASSTAISEKIPTTNNFALEKFLPEVVRLDKTEAEIVPDIAVIKKASFLDFSNEHITLAKGLYFDDEKARYRKETKGDNTLIFTSTDKNRVITKKLIYNKQLYYIDLEISVENKSDQPYTENSALTIGIYDYSRNNPDVQYSDVTFWAVDRPQHFDGKKNIVIENVMYGALRNRFFCIIVEPETKGYSGIVKKISDTQSEVVLLPKATTIPAGGSKVEKFKVYLGPQDANLISKYNSEWGGVVYFGTFDPISKIIIKILEFLYKMTHNWGVAIILLSVLIYFVLFPLSYKQMHSMKEMQLLQPKIEELKKAYKDNPQKLNKEMMELYKTHKVNPLSGCLPLLLQIPVFFALYQALIRLTAIKQAHFLWIKDLSIPDRLFIFPFSIPMLGNEFNLLPIIMAIGMFIQQKVSASSASSGISADQQKMMQIIFPIMFGFIFYKMPSGLVLYWLINSVLMLAYQIKITKASKN